MASPEVAAALVPHFLPGGLPFGEGVGRTAAPEAAPAASLAHAAAPAALSAPCAPASPRAAPDSPSADAERAADASPDPSNGTGCAGEAVPRPSAVPQPSRPLRCLDERHPPSCTRCCAAPPDEDVADCRLIGDPQKKNGEKKLRSLLTRTREWSDPASRVGLAEQLEAAHAAASASEHGAEVADDVCLALARLLRAKDCSGLRKASMLSLARHWGYRSDIWQKRCVAPPPRDGGSKRRRGPARAPRGVIATDDDAWQSALARLTAAQPMGSSHPRPLPRPLADPGTLALRPDSVAVAPNAAVAALRSLLTHSLAPLAGAAAATYAGERALAAARATPQGLRGQALPDRLRENTRLLQVMTWLAAQVRAQQQLVAGWRANLHAGALDAPAAAAWAALRGCEGPTAAVLRTLTEVVAAGEADSARIRAEVHARTPAGALAPAQLAWWAELDAGASAALRMLAHADAASAPLRVAPFEAYLYAADAVTAFAARFVADVEAAFRRRRVWMQAMHDADEAETTGNGRFTALDADGAVAAQAAVAPPVPTLTRLMCSRADPALAVLAAATPGGIAVAVADMPPAPPLASLVDAKAAPLGSVLFGGPGHGHHGGDAMGPPQHALVPEDDVFDLMLAGEFNGAWSI